MIAVEQCLVLYTDIVLFTDKKASLTLSNDYSGSINKFIGCPIYFP